MNFIASICLFIFNFLLYFMCGYMVYKRREYSCISIRSPILLYFNNIGGFLMSSCLILYLILRSEHETKSIQAWGYVFASFYFSQILMMISFFLRCQRIISCCQIHTDERVDIHRFIDKRYLFQEKYYFKILCFCILGSSIILILINCFQMITLNILTDCCDGLERNAINSYVWLILNFLEQIVMITYGYLMSVNDVKQKIKFELFMFLLIWFIFSNAIFAFEYYGKKDNEFITEAAVIVALFCLYCCLGLNGFFPFILSYCYKTSIAYYFNPKLMNNFYLFLTNESCYVAFSSYLKSSIKDSYYLRVYTHIMKFKLEFQTEENQETVLNEAKDIYRSYFDNPNDMLDSNVLENTKIACQQLVRGVFKNEMFDEALQFTFTYLGNRFIEFKNTEAYNNLYESLALSSYIQCKMCNTGLINKF